VGGRGREEKGRKGRKGRKGERKTLWICSLPSRKKFPSYATDWDVKCYLLSHHRAQ